MFQQSGAHRVGPPEVGHNGRASGLALATPWRRHQATCKRGQAGRVALRKHRRRGPPAEKQQAQRLRAKAMVAAVLHRRPQELPHLLIRHDALLYDSSVQQWLQRVPVHSFLWSRLHPASQLTSFAPPQTRRIAKSNARRKKQTIQHTSQRGDRVLVLPASLATLFFEAQCFSVCCCADGRLLAAAVHNMLCYSGDVQCNHIGVWLLKTCNS
mmetsp:Transcript_139281/g.277729  ORF Transcript_139281/g.277729 Transcript_139281/m.277729 type:complete len:212 (+) Transcript_139281:529-1164(+)